MEQKVEKLSEFFKGIYQNRELIQRLGKDDFKKKNAGSIFGIVWVFMLPMIYILVMWFVFTVGFKIQNIELSTPYIVWLTAGITPWFYFTEVWSASGSVLFEYSFLVKKVVFRVDILPIIKLFSSLYAHFFLILLSLIMMIYYQIPLSIYNVQIIYYFMMMCGLLLGISWLTAGITPFFRDFSNIVAVVIQVGFWITPIFWDISKLSSRVALILKLNPFFYIVEGYRDSLINHIWFWQRGWLNIWFWCCMVSMLLLGGMVFKKLKPHFADVL